MTVENNESSHEDTSRKYSDPSLKRRIPLHWLAERTDTSSSCRKNKDGTEVLLPSFVDLQRKTLQTLYGTVDGSIIGTDKSPKGSVDAPIQPLVDLINKSSSYCTLSSCSGRLSLFDPNGRHEGMQGSSPDAEDHDTNTNSGKGRGGWLLIRHEPIPPSDLVDCFPTEYEDGATDSRIPWVFKLEPMLLHIAARSLQKGKQLLQMALELGFRESGLVVSDARVTVAIRGHSLALSVPLAPKGPLRPTTFYLQALVQLANERLDMNWLQLDRLYDRIESSLFEMRVTPKLKATMIPSLNLWSAATVAISMPSSSDPNLCKQHCIYAFGGYGTGPECNRHGARRSSEIYKLQCPPHQADWGPSNDWEPVQIQNPAHENKVGQLAVSWVPKLPDCQGIQAVEIGSLILLWGGRLGPNKPIGDIYLFDPSTSSLAMPLDIRGTPPTPRWGHSIVALDDQSILVSGGCNLEEGAMNNVWILHFCHSYLFWEPIAQTLPTPLFHHMSVVENNTACVFGGLQSTSNLLEPFQKPRVGSGTDQLVWAIRIKKKEVDSSTGKVSSTVQVIQNTYQAATSGIESVNNCSINGLKKFGAAASSSDSLMLVSGGLASSGGDDDAPLDAYFLAADWDRISITKVPVEYLDDEVLDFGSLVHHASVPIGTNEFLLIGGGATSFAFGHSFARSYHIRLEMPATSPVQTLAKKTGPQSTTTTEGTNKKSSVTLVVRVAPKNAKVVKTKLESLGWLDKRYRMVKQSSDVISVPVDSSSLEAIQQVQQNPIEPWHSFLLGHGEEEMPFSTSQFAAKGKR